jgi:hypothetical protein
MMFNVSNEPVVAEIDEASGVGLNTVAYGSPTTTARVDEGMKWAYMDGLSDAEREQSIIDFIQTAHRWKAEGFTNRIINRNKKDTWEYIPRLSNAQREKSVHEFLRSAHRWSIKDFIRQLAHPEKVPYAHGAQVRVHQLRQAIIEQPEVLKIFIEDKQLIPSMLVEGISAMIREELYTLMQEVPLLGKFHVDSSPKDLNVKDFYREVGGKAPILWRLLQTISARLEDDTVSNQQNGSFALIAALLSHALAPRLSSGFQAYIGLHFHSLGARRRLIDLLHSLNISLSYDSILRYHNEIAKIAQVC